MEEELFFETDKNEFAELKEELMNEDDEKFMDFDDFLNENTVANYRYRFSFDGKKYFIKRGKKNKDIFGIKNDEGKWIALTKGNLFSPKKNGMDRNSFVEHIQKGIKYFNIRNPVTVDDVKDSDWRKFFKFEIEKKPGRINKKYVILKLHAGKAAAKWLSRND